MRALSLFSGAAGFEIGLHAAGQRAWVIRPSDWPLMVAIAEGRA